MKTEGYDLLIEAAAHAERTHLPGNIRQLVKRAINDLAFSQSVGSMRAAQPWLFQPGLR
jgi:hypothetical protein